MPFEVGLGQTQGISIAGSSWRPSRNFGDRVSAQRRNQPHRIQVSIVAVIINKGYRDGVTV